MTFYIARLLCDSLALRLWHPRIKFLNYDKHGRHYRHKLFAIAGQLYQTRPYRKPQAQAQKILGEAGS